jgi:hypothetical protein
MRSTVLVFLASLLGGVLVGAVAVVYHSAWFPLGLILSLVLTTVYATATRVLFSDRVSATGAALGVIITIVALAGSDRSGSVLILANTAGLTFLAVVTIVTMIVLAWPRFSSRATSYDRDVVSPERIPTP